MKKTMLLGTVLLTMLFGVTGCGNKAEAEVKHLTNEQVIATYLNEEDGIQANKIEVSGYTGDRYDADGVQRIDDDYVNYLAYNEDGELISIGGVDLSWAENTYCK